MDIQESLLQVLQRVEDRLADRFYLVFLQDYPEVQEHFHDVNLEEQAALLTIALQVSVQHHLQPLPATASYLRVLGRKHREWGIPLEHFPLFLDALLHALAEFHDDEWDDKLAHQWRAAIGGAVSIMQSGYDE